MKNYTICLTCENCDQSINTPSSDHHQEQESSSGGMGAKLEHWTQIELDCDCGQTLEALLNVTEYPIGNFEAPELSNCRGVSKAKIID